MTVDPNDPPRWADASADAPRGLSALLRDGQADVPSTGEVDAMFARLSAKLPSPGLAPPAPPQGVAAPAPWGRLGKALGVLAVAGAGALVARAVSSPEAPAVPPPAPVVAPAPVPTPEAVPPPEERAVTPPPVEPTASTPSTPAPKPRAAPKVGEAELLEAARRALATDPARALKLTETHKARFPTGILQQEREVIAIDALRRLGRSDAATNRAEKFEDKFPDSAHRRGVEAGQRKP